MYVNVGVGVVVGGEKKENKKKRRIEIEQKIGGGRTSDRIIMSDG